MWPEKHSLKVIDSIKNVQKLLYQVYKCIQLDRPSGYSRFWVDFRHTGTYSALCNKNVLDYVRFLDAILYVFTRPLFNVCNTRLYPAPLYWKSIFFLWTFDSFLEGKNNFWQNGGKYSQVFNALNKDPLNIYKFLAKSV